MSISESRGGDFDFLIFPGVSLCSGSKMLDVAVERRSVWAQHCCDRVLRMVVGWMLIELERRERDRVECERLAT